MSLELIGALVGVFSVASAVAGYLVGLGRDKQMIRDHEKRITRLEADDDAEDAARLRRRGADA
jgi:hypothetical protein